MAAAEQRQVRPDRDRPAACEQLRQLAPQAEDDESQQQRVDVPAQQQGETGLDQQLPEAAFLRENHHAVEGQQHPEQIRHHLVGNHVVVIQAVAGREGEQRGGQGDPAVGDEPAERQEGERGGGGEEGQHQQPGGANLRRQAVAEGRHRQLDQPVTGRRKAVVRKINRVPVRVQGAVVEQQEVVLRRQIRGHRQGVRHHGGSVGVPPVEVTPAAAEQEHRRQRKQQQRQRKARTAPGVSLSGCRAAAFRLRPRARPAETAGPPATRHRLPARRAGTRTRAVP